MPGVLGVLTGKDMPVPFGILPVSQDEHALCLDRVRFVGDPVAAIAALTEDQAADACTAIEVDYEPLATIASIEEAVNTPEPRIHRDAVKPTPRKGMREVEKRAPYPASYIQNREILHLDQRSDLLGDQDIEVVGRVANRADARPPQLPVDRVAAPGSHPQESKCIAIVIACDTIR